MNPLYLTDNKTKKTNKSTTPLEDKQAYMGGLLSRFEQSSKANERARGFQGTSKPPSITKQNPWEHTFATGSVTPQGFTSKGGYTLRTPTSRSGSFPTGRGDTKINIPDPDIGGPDDGGPDDGGTKDNGCTGGQVPDGRGGCKDPEPPDQGCGEGQEPDGQGGCRPVTTTQDDDDGTPSLTTITQPDETPDLQALTEDMDLRNMLTNVLNKNNPLSKQARTRAFQAMAARGIVNSSMAEEAVMSAVMNVAMPIAQRVITDFQEVMKANVNKSNEFKMALNNMYYQELLRRVDAANTWNLERMKSQQVNWQTVLGAKVEGMGIKDDPAYERYMSMLSKLGSQPSWNVAG